MREISNITMRDVIWVGDSRDQVRSFPKTVKTKLGEALRVAQRGGQHPRAKPLRSVGSGVLEIISRSPIRTALFIQSILMIKSMYFTHSRRNLPPALVHLKEK